MIIQIDTNKNISIVDGDNEATIEDLKIAADLFEITVRGIINQIGETKKVPFNK